MLLHAHRFIGKVDVCGIQASAAGYLVLYCYGTGKSAVFLIILVFTAGKFPAMPLPLKG